METDSIDRFMTSVKAMEKRNNPMAKVMKNTQSQARISGFPLVLLGPRVLLQKVECASL
jgi:hypothetical protein